MKNQTDIIGNILAISLIGFIALFAYRTYREVYAPKPCIHITVQLPPTSTPTSTLTKEQEGKLSDANFDNVSVEVTHTINKEEVAKIPLLFQKNDFSQEHLAKVENSLECIHDAHELVKVESFLAYAQELIINFSKNLFNEIMNIASLNFF